MLRALVDSLAHDPSILEMIVVVDGDDAASVRELAAIQKEQPFLAFHNPSHVGHLAALDRGVRQAGGDIVLLLDDDVLPGPMLASGHARAHGGQRNLVVTGSMPVYLEEGVTAPVGTRLYAREHQGQMDRIERGEIAVLDGLWAGNLSMRREVCLRIGLASTEFDLFYHSDRELGYRLAAAGLIGVYEPTLAAVHLHNRDAAAFLPRRPTSGSRARTAPRHVSRPSQSPDSAHPRLALGPRGQPGRRQGWGNPAG